MKKLILLPLIFASFAQAEKMVPPSTCRDYGWVEIWTSPIPITKEEKPVYMTGFNVYCLLPNNKSYDPYTIEQEPNFESLVKKYEGKKPSSEQVKKAKEKLRKQGYEVD